MAIAYIGIGSNIGDKRVNCENAILKLESLGGIKILKCSTLYPTKPVGGPKQEDYINGVVKLETEMPPLELLEAVKRIEKDMGREPSRRNYPRIIDLDILLYDEVILRGEKLTIPHPRMRERDFVLKGLREIAPDICVM
ncbi:MAG: 2-amino-4-hydroxy-6-hydroxymethyldihydropteridine diphosphokinase [Candidatus Omnitrophota bacterium]